MNVLAKKTAAISGYSDSVWSKSDICDLKVAIKDEVMTEIVVEC